MFKDGRAQNGMIVLPCGGGKSLIGVKATCSIRKRTLIFCTSVFSVKQWAEQFLRWSNINDNGKNRIIEFTSKIKDPDILNLLTPKNAVVVITTYRMLFWGAGHDTREEDNEKLNAKIRNRIKELEWGLVVLDEVHVAPADTFSMTLREIKSHCKLGLTATPLREDERMNDLEYLIGPKLHEENWKDLENDGFLARALCVEVIWCILSLSYRKI